ncbi:sigma-54 dependent transcriptional regulator [Xanthobacter sp. KR7-65]|uniref:sigma-54-dependent transcriptional regulator n=1 Tax=Xanthobacter sp. KR7-65 TaxID=3156612 RepID=UPI0032B5EF5F
MAQEREGAGRQKVLLVEDTVPIARLYLMYLANMPYDVRHVELGAAALAALETERPDVILLDLQLPDMNGLDVLREVHAKDSSIAVIVVTANGSIGTAVEAMRAGAFDFLVKPFNAERLEVTLRNAAERRQLGREIARYQQFLDREKFHRFIGACDEMRAVYRIIETVGPSKASVFITGESGTGKELAAEAIHLSGPRRSAPFVTLNCAAIPKELLESEIFGHVKGAFTGATADRIGAAQQANGGTLFLDEIGEMPYDLQAKLLRFLQTGVAQPVGASRGQNVDVRFIAATNRDPQAEVAAGRFREDLFYRLYVVPVHLPPLRERGDDVLLIARHHLQEVAAEERRQFKTLAPEVEAIFRTYDWPGNVRQLLNVLRNVVILHDGETVTADMLPRPLYPVGAMEGTSQLRNVLPPVPAAIADTRIKPLWQLEKDAILAALEATENDVPRAAALLEVSPSTIYRKIQVWKGEAGGDVVKSIGRREPKAGVFGT